MHHVIEWLDSGYEPVNPPNPQYPDGMNVNLALGPAAKSCLVQLPYPARRCGVYQITCRECEIKVALTTAGRADDPCSVRIGCKVQKGRQN